jgi:hypothetical protein
MKKKLFKIGFLFMGISLITLACRKERNGSPPDGIETLSKEEVMSFLGKEENSLKPKNYDENYVTPDFSNISMEKLSNSSQLIAVIPATTIYPEHYSRILLVKVNKKITAIIFSMYADNSSQLNKFSGEILITDLQGSFINGFRASEGILKTQFIKIINAKSSNTSMSTSVLSSKNSKELMYGSGSTCSYHECFEGSSCIECVQALKEVVITASAKINFIELRYWSPIKFSSDEFSNISWDFSYEGLIIKGTASEGPTPCWSGYIRTANNECVPLPCPGDPVRNPEIAPQNRSKIPGGLHNTCARIDPRNTCYGKVGYRLHDGVDIVSDFGNPIFAMYDGNAIIKYQPTGAGHHITITSSINGDKVELTYFHLQETGMKSGLVQAGDIIGYQGRSGNLDNAIKQGHAISHVHVQAKKNEIMTNPLNYFATKIDPKTGKVLNPCF